MNAPSVSLEFAILIALILMNAMLAMIETAITASRKAALEKSAEAGSSGAKAALEIVENPAPLLHTVQTGITLTGILIGAFSAATLIQALSPYLADIPYVNVYSSILAAAIVVALTTYVTLILGELVPKRIARNNPEAILAVMAQPIRCWAGLTRPLTSFLTGSARLVLGFLGVNAAASQAVTEDEIRTLIEQGTEAGTFEKREQDMVDKIFRLGDLRAYAMMTPRTQIVWLDLDEPLAENIKILKENNHTRYPVGRGSLDDFVGMIYSNDLLSRSLNGEPVNLEACIRTPMFIPKSMKAFKVLESFQQSTTHEAVVLDEFGGVVGFITIHDILAEIIGDLPFDSELDEAQMIARDDGSWLIDGLVEIDDFKEYFAIDELPDEERDHYQTVGGFVTSYLGYIPAAAEKFVWGGLQFEIVDMDRVRVDKILVTRLPPQKARETEGKA